MNNLEYQDVQKSNLFYFSISVAHGTRVQPNRLPTGATSKCIFTLILKLGMANPLYSCFRVYIKIAK